MSQFYSAFKAQEESYLAHHGVKGMKWGVRKEYQPVQRPDASYQEMPSSTPTAQTTNSIRDASPEKVNSHKKNILKGLAIGAGVGAVIAGSILGYKKTHTRPSVLTEDGEKLKKAMEGI